MASKVLPVPVPVIGHAVKHAARGLKPHFIFLMYRVGIFVPAIMATMPHDHAVFLIDAAVIETSGIVVLFVHKFTRAIRALA